MKTIKEAAKENARNHYMNESSISFLMDVESFIAGAEFAQRWYMIGDKNNPVPNEGDILIMLKDGSIRRYDENWEEEFGLSGIVIHWRYIELK